MKPRELPALTAEQVDAVAKLSRSTQTVRLHTRAPMGLLAAEQHLGVRESAASVRECEGTVRCWLKRSSAHGIDGVPDAWAGGAPAKVTPAYQDQVLQFVRRRPRRLDLPYATWTLPRLADYLAERGSGWRKKPCASIAKRPRWCCVGPHLRAAARPLRRR